MILVLKHPERGQGMAPHGGSTAVFPLNSAFKERLQANLSLRATENNYWSTLKAVKANKMAKAGSLSGSR